MTLRHLLSIGVLTALVATHLHAQNRDVRAQRMVLDDNNGNAIIVNTAPGPITGGTLTIPDPAGAGQFLISTPPGGTQSAFGHLLPGTDNLYNLGSGTFRWRHLFLSGNLQLGSGFRLTEPGGSDYTEFVAQAQANNITYTLPATNGTAGQVLQIASTPAPTATAATLEWGGSAGVLYNVSSQQATATPRTNYLFDVAYAATAPDAASTGARISSSAGAAGNNNATALTLVATKTGTGTATALDATGNVNISEGSLLNVGSGGSTINAGGTPVATTPYAEQVSNLITDFATPAAVNLQKLTNLSFTPTANHFIVAQDIRNYDFTIPTGVTIGPGGGGMYANATLVNDISTAATGGSVDRVSLDQQNFTVASTSNTSYAEATGSYAIAQLDGGVVNDLYGMRTDLIINAGADITNSLTGVRANVSSSSSSGPVPEMYGVNINVNAGPAGVATRAEGINMNVTGDDAVGLRISGVSGYTTSYAIRSDASAQSYFNGNVGIGQLVPTQKLEVRGGNLLLSNGGTEGELQLQEPNGSGTEYTAFKAQAQANDITYTLPAVNGTDGQVLRLATGATATTGTLEWGTASGSGWSLTGNGGTTPGTDFVGTTDAQAFEIRVDNGGTATEGRRRVMRYEPNAASANIIGGFNGNSVTAGAVGATIAGGGSNGAPNSVTDDYGMVGGGQNNRAGNNATGTTDARFATVGGGSGNKASGTYSIVGGGTNNTASGTSSAVNGGDGNTASGNSSTVGGGVNNIASAASASTVGGGGENTAAGDLSAIPGGLGLTLDASADGSFGFLGGNTGSNNMTISAPNVAVFGNTDLWLANNDGAASELRFFENYSGSGAFPNTANYTAFKAQTQANDITYTLPAVNGTDGQVLRLATGATATTGTLEWGTASGLTLPFSSTTSNASTLFNITNSGSGQASNFNISGAKTASTTTTVVDNDATNTTTNSINKTVLSVASSGDFSGAGGGSTTATGIEISMTGTGGDVNKGMTIAVAGNDAIGLQISSGRLAYSVASIAHPSANFTGPNNAAIIKVTDNGTNSGNANLTLSTTDVIEGQVVCVYNGDVNDNVVVQSTPTRTLNSGATNRDLWQFIYIDGAWRPLR